jgi:hypothetical protein
MKTLWQERDRRELLERARHLTPESTARWGKFTVDRMLAHLVDAFRMGLGEIVVKPKKLPIRHWPLNVLFIRLVGMPKHAPTAREIISRPPDSIEEELRKLDAVMQRFIAMKGRTDWPVHPALGKLSSKSWGILGYKHMDHHLRQFGV